MTHTDIPYDSAPYDALAQEQRSGVDVRQRVAALITDTLIRVGLLAHRLNLAGIACPSGGRWSRMDVLSERDRERLRRERERLLGKPQ